ncbi:MAG: NAD(P)H-dependent oxidoreductase [Chloroflexota bacterium]
MQLLLISGSRNPAGQTARAAEAVLAGYAAAGGQATRLYLPELAIERCRQCDERGWGTCRSAGDCVIEDDLDQVVAAIRAADAVLFATPVYYGDLSESMRALTDRLRRCATHMADAAGIKGKIAVGVCVAGGGGGGAPTCCVSLERVLRIIGFDLVDIIPVRRQNLVAKLAQLKLVGAWLATGPASG